MKGARQKFVSAQDVPPHFQIRSGATRHVCEITAFYCVDCGSNVISNMKIRGAKTALSFAVGDVSLRNVDIVSSSTALSLPTSASLRLVECSFVDNKFAINAVEVVGAVNISSCSFERNQNAVLLRNGIQTVDVDDSRFTANTQAFAVTASAPRGSAVVFVRRSRFDNEAVELTAGQNAALSASVHDCTFNSSVLIINGYRESHTSSVAVTDSSFQSSGVRVSISSTLPQSLTMSIAGCSFRRLAYHPTVELSASSLRSVTISGNVFNENRRAPCIKIGMPASTSGSATPGLISIVGNSFANHSGSNVVVVNDNAYHRMHLRRNVFMNPQCEFDVELQSPWKSGYAVNASDNFWGSANRTYVAGRISDVFMDSKKSKVSIISMYSDPEMTQIAAFPELRTWNVTDANLVGGELDRNVTLTSSTAAYFVNKTIYIPKGFQLKLAGNLTLHFAAMRGIIVEGGLYLPDND